MKKQINKLDLNKRTISNLSNAEMSQQLGGEKTKGKNCGGSVQTSEVTMQGCGSIYRHLPRRPQ